MNKSPNHQIGRTTTPTTSQKLPVEFFSNTLCFSLIQRLLDLSWRSLLADKKGEREMPSRTRCVLLGRRGDTKLLRNLWRVKNYGVGILAAFDFSGR